MNLVRKYTWTLPAGSPHKDILQKTGIGFGLVMTRDKLDIKFEKRY